MPLIVDVPVDLQACEACRELECDTHKASACRLRVLATSQETEKRAGHRSAVERLSLGACSRILSALAQGVEGMSEREAKRLEKHVARYFGDPTEPMVAAMIVGYCTQYTSLIQCLEPPIDGWSNV